MDFNPPMKRMFSQGEWCPKEHRININGNLDEEELLKTTVFELCNSINPAFQNIDLKDLNSGTEYAELIEKNEAKSYKLAYDAFMILE